MSVERAEGREEILREESGENGRAVVWNDDVMCVRFVNSLRGGGVAGWKESFQKHKVNGQLALEHGVQGVGRGALLSYISAYVSKGPELQLRGLVHSHVPLRRIGPEDGEEAVRRLLIDR